MLVARDYNDNEYPLLAVKIVNSELNGQEDIELTIHQQSNNGLDLKTIDKLWELDYNNITYKIVYVKQQTRGSGFYLNVRATPLFYWEFDKSIIHEDNDGSHTANSAFRTVFEGTDYNFVLVDFSPSVEIEGFGKGSTRLELFKRLLDRYNYEFTINGSTVTMRHLVGNDTNFMYKYKLNASNVSRSTDATAMFTHIKGFGNFEEGEEDYFNNAKLKREFTSPLADIVGKWEGPPIVDGRMTQQSTLDNAMQKAVEDSLEISVEGTLHDIRQMGYDIAVPIKGDRVWLLDERINLEQEIRVYSVKTTYDERDNIIDCEVTFGSQSIRDRHKANINSLSKNFQDLLTGKLKLPVISLEKIGMDMINAIHAASSEIVFGDFGMQAISKTNPNHVFGLNSEGWYISQDGGRTPRTIATAQGIYADAIFAGTLWLTNDLNIEGIDGYLNISSQRFTMRNHNGTSSTVIEPGRLQMNQSDFELGGGADVHLLDAGNKIYYQREDSQGSQMRSAGVGFGRSINDRFPFAYLGTSDSGRPQAVDENDFAGFITNTLERSKVDGIGNSAVGDIFHVRDNAMLFSKGFLYNLNTSADVDAYFSPINTGSHNYHLGRPNNRWNQLYLQNEPNVFSDERYKTGMTAIDKASEIIEHLKPIEYRMKLTNNDLIKRNQNIRERGPNKTQFGFSAQQIKETMDLLGIDRQTVVEIDDEGRYGVKTGQIIPLLVAHVQSLSKRIEVLENAEQTNDTE